MNDSYILKFLICVIYVIFVCVCTCSVLFYFASASTQAPSSPLDLTASHLPIELLFATAIEWKGSQIRLWFTQGGWDKALERRNGVPWRKSWTPLSTMLFCCELRFVATYTHIHSRYTHQSTKLPNFINAEKYAFEILITSFRRRRGLILDHGEAEEEEQNVPAGLHGACVRLFLLDDYVTWFTSSWIMTSN